MRCDAWVGALLWRSCQSPVAHSCIGIILSFCRGMFKCNTIFDADPLLYSLSFRMWWSTVHMLTQQCPLSPLTSRVKYHCSCVHILVHTPWLPGYVDVAQTVLVILTMVWLFPDRPCITDVFIYWILFRLKVNGLLKASCSWQMIEPGFEPGHWTSEFGSVNTELQICFNGQYAKVAL